MAKVDKAKIDKLLTHARLQQECVRWFHNQYPKLRGLLCNNKNNSVNEIQGKVDKMLGTIAGRSDLTFYYKKTAYFFEVKVGRDTQGDDQLEWEKLVRDHGFEYFIIREDVETFKEEIKKILENE